MNKTERDEWLDKIISDTHTALNEAKIIFAEAAPSHAAETCMFLSYYARALERRIAALEETLESK